MFHAAKLQIQKHQLFSRLNPDSFIQKSIPVEDALKYNHIRPSKKPGDYDAFWEDYEKLGFAQTAAKYAKDKLPDNLVYIGKKWARRILVKLHLIGY